MKHKFTLVLALLLSATFSLTAQYNPKQSIHLGLAANSFYGDSFEGNGTLINLGFQKQLKNPRLRFNPDLAIGFNDNSDMNVPNFIEFTSISLRSVFQYDFVRTGFVSVFFGAGGAFNYTTGTISDTTLDSAPARSTNSLHMALIGNAGLRFLPNHGNFGFEIVPFNLQAGNDKYLEVFALARIFLSLDGKRSEAATKH